MHDDELGDSAGDVTEMLTQTVERGTDCLRARTRVTGDLDVHPTVDQLRCDVDSSQALGLQHDLDIGRRRAVDEGTADRGGHRLGQLARDGRTGGRGAACCTRRRRPIHCITQRCRHLRWAFPRCGRPCGRRRQPTRARHRIGVLALVGRQLASYRPVELEGSRGDSRDGSSTRERPRWENGRGRFGDGPRRSHRSGREEREDRVGTSPDGGRRRGERNDR